jgi:uncharacterized protein
MHMKKHLDIIALKPQHHPAVAFHVKNFEYAELTDSAWQAMENESPEHGQEERNELTQWSQNTKTIPAETHFQIKSITLNVTQICNLHCSYCAAGGDGTYGDPIKKISIEKTLPQLKFFIDKLRPGDDFHISFLGGEPLLYPEAIQLIGEYVQIECQIKKISSSFKITTNGTLLNEQNIKILQTIRPRVVVSIDGPEHIHDKQRKQKNGLGSFAAVESGLKIALRNKHLFAGIDAHAVFNKQHTKILETWNYLSALESDGQKLDSMEFTLSVTSEDLSVTQSYNAQMRLTAEQAWLAGGENELLRISNFKSLFRRIESQVPLTSHCGIGKTMVVIDSRQQIWNCPWTVGQTQNLMGSGTYLRTEKIEQYQEQIIDRNDCNTCWARFLCGGGCSFVHNTVASSLKLQKKQAYCEQVRDFTELGISYFFKSRINNAFDLTQRTI